MVGIFLLVLRQHAVTVGDLSNDIVSFPASLIQGLEVVTGLFAV